MSALPLRLRSVEGGALRVFVMEPGMVTIQSEAADGALSSAHLDRWAAMAVRDALDGWIKAQAAG